MSTQDLVSNRKASYDYEILETFEAGIVLTGSEIKSLRDHGGSLQDSFIIVKEGELWLLHSSIAPYRHGASYNHPEKRERKLLMHKNEILKLKKALDEKGMTLIPLSFYLKSGKVKVKVAIAKGKKSYDRRKTIQEREEKRKIQRIMREQKED